MRRMRSQLLTGNPKLTPHEVVAHFGAVQAQDFLGALWAIGLRMRGGTDADVERDVAERKIIRCWPMRGTLHFVAAEDARWMLELLASRSMTRSRGRLEREFGLDAATLRRARTLIERALRGGHALTRGEIYAMLERGGIATGASRGLHILYALSHERVICFGPRRGKQPALVLLDEWLPEPSRKTREESLAELARRYFTGHGPATAADLVWWSGLTVKSASEAISLAANDLERETIDGNPMWSSRTPISAPRSPRAVHLLPPFDEFMVGYKDRSAMIAPEHVKAVNIGGGMINAVLVINGLVTGRWSRALNPKSVDFTISPFRALTASETRAIEREVSRYGEFVGREGRVAFA